MKDGKFDVSIRDPTTVAFGFGRRCVHLAFTPPHMCSRRAFRVCPGRHFATSAMLIYFASILHVFSIKPPMDEQGRPIFNQPKQSLGLVS